MRDCKEIVCVCVWKRRSGGRGELPMVVWWAILWAFLVWGTVWENGMKGWGVLQESCDGPYFWFVIYEGLGDEVWGGSWEFPRTVCMVILWVCLLWRIVEGGRRELGSLKDHLKGHSIGLSFMRGCSGWEEGLGAYIRFFPGLCLGDGTWFSSSSSWVMVLRLLFCYFSWRT